MNDIAERVRVHWSDHGVAASAGVSEAELHQFEVRHGLFLPDDMRACFLHVNGMTAWDEDLFRFFPLEEVECLAQFWPGIPIRNASAVFLFADHSIILPGYAIRLDAANRIENEVIAVFQKQGMDGFEISVVALSFSEFVERYLRNDSTRLDLSDGIRRPM
jgi:hypothetical protein